MCLCVCFLKQFNSKTRDGFTVNSKVPSMKDPGKEYDGFTITITGDRYSVCLERFVMLTEGQCLQVKLLFFPHLNQI